MNQKIKLSEMGTTGLVQFVVSGCRRMRGARMGRAKQIIAHRFSRWENVKAFQKAVNRALGFK